MQKQVRPESKKQGDEKIDTQTHRPAPQTEDILKKITEALEENEIVEVKRCGCH